MLYIKERIENGDFGHAHTIKAHIGGMGPAAWRQYSGQGWWRGKVTAA